MSATITLRPFSRPGLGPTLVVARILTWSITQSSSGNAWTRIWLDGCAESIEADGDHNAALRAAVEAHGSKIDEDIELIASLQKRVEVLEAKMRRLELEP